MARASSGESKAGLVVALIMFILATIALGVTTYYGYQEADKARQEAVSAKDKQNKAEKTTDWYRFLALTYRQYLGKPVIDEKTGEPVKGAVDELTERRKGYAGGTGALVNSAKDGDPYVNQNLALVKDLDTRFKWDENNMKPAATYEAELARLEKERQALEAKLGQEKERADDLEKQLTAEKENLDKQKKTAAAELAALQQKTLKDLEGLQSQVAALNKATEELKEKGGEDVKKVDDARIALEKQLKKAEAENKVMAKTLDTQKMAKIDRMDYDLPKGRILKIDPNGQTVYINLGSADGLKPMDTFSVRSGTADGRAVASPAPYVPGRRGRVEVPRKASIEVLQVMGEHLAQARVREDVTRDPNLMRDPLVPGDLLHNPLWNPNMRQHVAIAGRIDLNGDGADRIGEFMRGLQQRGIEVDAYLDPKTNKVVGNLTRSTDYLILGEGPDFDPSTRDMPRNAAKDEVYKAMSVMQDEATKMGIQTIKLRDFLVKTGYRTPTVQRR